MNRPRVLLLLSLLISAGALAPGCSDQSQVSYASSASSEEDFAQGDGRAPTLKTLYSLARVFRGQGKLPEARGTLVKIIREYPTFVPAYQDLAELHLQGGQVDQAIKTLHAGIDAVPKEPTLHNNLGMCHLMREDYDSALESFTKAAQLAPSDARFRANLALSLGMLGRDEEAMAEYLRVLEPPDAKYNMELIAQTRKVAADRAAELSAARAPMKVQATLASQEDGAASQ